MLNRLFHTVRGFFVNPSPTFESCDSFIVDQQLRADLLRATIEGMVTTRLQDHTLPNNGIPKTIEAATPKSVSGKRKYVENTETLVKQSSAKRKRSGSKPDNVTTESSVVIALGPEVVEVNAPVEESGVNKESNDERRNTNNAETRHHVEKVAGAIVHESPNMPEAIVSTSDLYLSTDSLTEVNGKVSQEAQNDDSTIGTAKEIDLGKKVGNSRRRKSRAEPDERTRTAATADLSNGVSQIGFGASTKVHTHKRFGTEEPEIVETTISAQVADVNQNPSAPHQTTIEEESEDDAPEALTAAAGLEQSRNATTEAARAVARYAIKRAHIVISDLTIHRQRKITREKRQAHGTLLKEQAQLAKKASHRDKNLSSKSSADTVASESGAIPVDCYRSTKTTKSRTKDRLPLLLPDEILAVEPTTRPLTPPLETVASKPQKYRFLERGFQHPKDVKKGSLTVRVLKIDNSVLPPKVSKVSKSFKETWLAGRRGRQGGIGLERRKIGAGFVRK